MRKILSPTDFSKNADSAMHFAAELCKISNAQLILVHAMHVPIIDASTPVDTSSELIEEQRSMSDNKMQAYVNDLSASYGIKVNSVCEFGFAVDLICRTAKTDEVDAIVMGTKGASNLIEEIMGSITSGVIKKSVRPVIAVPANSRFKKFDRIAFATDLSDDDSKEIEAFHRLTSIYQPEIHVVHVEINEKLASLPGHHHVSTIVEEHDNIKRVELKADDVEHALHDYVVREHITMLAVKRHNRGFFKELFHRSITKQLAYHTNIPLMVFHEDKN